MTAPSTPPRGIPETAFGVLVGVIAALGCVCAAAGLVALVTGNEPPKSGLSGAVRVLTRPGDPSAAWGTPMSGPVLYWTVTAAVLAAALAAGVVAWWWWRRDIRRRVGDPRRLSGTATRAEVATAAGARAVMQRSAHTRPNLAEPRPGEVGYLLGRSRGVQAWASVEDSMLVLGPPRSGKGLHLVIPFILDAPGAVVTTSTRPDNLTATFTARRKAGGRVAVFDPQHLAAGVPDGLRWSPIRGCATAQTAMIRARGLAAGTGITRGVDGGDFWAAQTEAVLRALLHAAALDDRPPAQLYRWSLDPAAAGEAVTILGRSSAAAPGWSDALDQAASADPRTRDSIWLGVRQALSSLADPRVLDAVTPTGSESFDPAAFLRDRGTLYVLGTATGAGAAAPLVAALIEDVVETARRLAAASTGARLDPPLLLALDEIGNLAPLPSLPALMSEGGGTGITTLTVLQSLAQARSAWGEQAAAAMWDAAITKIILGGGSNARDLTDLATLIGDRDEHTTTLTRGHRGERTTSQNIRRVPIMDTARLRTLPFGTAVLLLRSAPPIVLDLHPWTRRPDARDLADGRTEVERQLHDQARVTWGDQAVPTVPTPG